MADKPQPRALQQCKEDPLVAYGSDAAGNVKGTVLFPLDVCRVCIPGAYSGELADGLPLESSVPVKLEFLSQKPGHMIFAGCERYFALVECPHFQKLQKALFNGWNVNLGPYKP